MTFSDSEKRHKHIIQVWHSFSFYLCLFFNTLNTKWIWILIFLAEYELFIIILFVYLFVLVCICTLFTSYCLHLFLFFCSASVCCVGSYHSSCWSLCVTHPAVSLTPCWLVQSSNVCVFLSQAMRCMLWMSDSAPSMPPLPSHPSVFISESCPVLNGRPRHLQRHTATD